MRANAVRTLAASERIWILIAATLAAITVQLSLISPALWNGNAIVCGALSGPHDRYGARMVWIATFAVLIILMRSFANDGSGSAKRSDAA